MKMFDKDTIIFGMNFGIGIILVALIIGLILIFMDGDKPISDQLLQKIKVEGPVCVQEKITEILEDGIIPNIRDYNRAAANCNRNEEAQKKLKILSDK